MVNTDSYKTVSLFVSLRRMVNINTDRFAVKLSIMLRNFFINFTNKIDFCVYQLRQYCLLQIVDSINCNYFLLHLTILFFKIDEVLFSLIS